MERITNFRAEDVITDVLKSVSFSSVVFCRSELRAPWAFSVAGRDVAGFHFVTRGSCWLSVAGDTEPVKLTAGDLIILTRGDEHSVADDLKTVPTRLDVLLANNPVDGTNTFRIEGDGPITEIVCGGFFFSDWNINPLLSTLPRVLHTKGREGQAAHGLQMTLKLITEEIKTNRPGAEGAITKLADVLFIQAVRAFLSTEEGRQAGWLRGLTDPQIGRAINLIHCRPEIPWTVKSLASRVGLSRSSFAERFQSLVYESPLHYLTRWRLNKAAVHLKTTTAKLSEVAKHVGYGSEFAFSRAFKRATGVSPGAYRKTGATS